MENKINIAELLKNCPSGMELDCTMYDNLYFDSVEADYYHTINCYTLIDGIKTTITFTRYGAYNNHTGAKCVIFPKGKTTWDEFTPPCKFKYGDIVATKTGSWIGITAGGVPNKFIPTYCIINRDNQFEEYFGKKEKWCFDRLASEEEKQKLFQAIKDNGYHWNTETKTLEKLVIKPKFKVGDCVVHHKYGKGDITEIIWIDNEIVYITHFENSTIYCKTNDLCKYELAHNKFDINTLVPFESKVLVRHNKDNKWSGSFFSFIDKDHHSFCYEFVTTSGKSYPIMIPYEGNEHLLGTTNDCAEYYKTWEYDTN